MADQEFAPLEYNVTGLRGKRLRVVTRIPTDGMAAVDLPDGITDVIALDDQPDVFSNLQVHPVGDPSTVVNIRYDQLAFYTGHRVDSSDADPTQRDYPERDS